MKLYKFPVRLIETFIHLLTLFLLIITLNLLLDFRLRGIHLFQSDFNFYNDFILLLTFITISTIMGVTSIVLIILKWIREKKTELYLKSFLITNIILVISISLLIFI